MSPHVVTEVLQSQLMTVSKAFAFPGEMLLNWPLRKRKELRLCSQWIFIFVVVNVVFAPWFEGVNILNFSNR